MSHFLSLSLSNNGKRNWRYFHTLGLALIGIVYCLLLVGCGDDRSHAKDLQKPPWPEENSPTDLQALAEDLVAFQTTMGRLPMNLGILDRSGLITGGPYSAKQYVYHPAGLGVLREGWRVMAADDRMRQPDRLWCVVRPPVRVIGYAPLRVVAIPLDELDSAAAAAGGG
jgi:hypothetical protein